MAPRPDPQPSAPRIQPVQGQMPIDDDTTVQRTGGRDARPSPRSDAVTHEPRTNARGGVVVKGRNGEVLSRGKAGTTDAYEIPEDIIPKGWRYQWNTVSVIGNAEVARRHNLTMYAQGWRPVPANRHPGMFMPLNHEGPIEIEGMRLEERPEELCAEAEYEDKVRALTQMKDRDEALMGRRANLQGSMHQDLKLNPRANYKGRKTQLSIDETYEIAPPNYQPADDSQP
jgi:hypothetical protein